MNNGFLKKLVPHVIAVFIFLIVALVFCSPSLSGKVINQSDVVLWKGAAQQSLLFKEKYGHFPLWTNSNFGGMPAYQIAMESQNVVSPGYFHQLFTLFLPKPISFFFLICVCFYFLTQVYRVNPWIGILGALAYGYASYNPIIVTAGHDTKMLAMAYVPALLGALILLYEKKYWLGAALTALFSALLIGMNHLQISYYFLIIAAIMSVGYIYHWIKEKDFKHLAIALSIALVAGITGVLSNATNIFVTYDYSKATIRNGTLGLDTSKAQQKKAGLGIDYAFEFSYGKTETFTLLFPNLYGGTHLEENSKTASLLTDKGFPEDQANNLAMNLPAYWGPQRFTSPVYLGAIICFLFLFGMVYLKTWHKWWLLAASVLGIIMSWGNHFEAFNAFLFNYLPFYNKFRAPSMTLVVPQLCFAIVAVLALQRFFFGEDSLAEKGKALKLSAIITGGVLLVGVMLYFSFNYKGANDEAIQQNYYNGLAQQMAQGAPPTPQMQQQANDIATTIIRGLRQDRQSLFAGDLLRSIILILLAAAIMYLYIRNKIKFTLAIAGLLILNTYDLIGVGKRFLNENNFSEPDQYEAAFMPTQADQQIKQDNGYYRVLNLNANLLTDAITSYHHNSVGGYNAARLSVAEDLINYQISKQPVNLNVVNMLNTKYVITQNPQTGEPVAQQNPAALGAAWFVKGVRFEKNGLPIMNALNTFDPATEAIVAEEDKKLVTAGGEVNGTIQLVENKNDEITYQSNATGNGFAVFSEIFYDRGWKAYIDGKETPIIRTNYALRGLNIPAGNHQIRFEFKPQSYYTGERVAMIAGLLIWVFILLAAFQIYRNYKKKVAVK